MESLHMSGDTGVTDYFASWTESTGDKTVTFECSIHIYSVRIDFKGILEIPTVEREPGWNHRTRTFSNQVPGHLQRFTETEHFPGEIKVIDSELVFTSEREILPQVRVAVELLLV